MRKKPKRHVATNARPPTEPEPTTVAKSPETGSGEDTSGLPEKIGSADLEMLNQALAALFNKLRFARSLPMGRKAHGRLAAVVALSATWRFLLRFEAVATETLASPIMSLQSALLALNHNNVEPILKPTPRTGRALSSPRRYALIGIAVGAAQQLEWTGLSAADANSEAAKRLSALGIKPTRGKNGVTADTLRRWRDQISAVQPLLRSLSLILQSDLSDEDIAWINAAVLAESMMTEKRHAQIAALPAGDARRFVLLLLEKSVTKMALANPA